MNAGIANLQVTDMLNSNCIPEQNVIFASIKFFSFNLL